MKFEINKFDNYSFSNKTSILEKLDYKIIDGNIKVNLQWYKRNIEVIELPQLEHCTPYWKNIKVNKAIASQTLLLFEELDHLGLDKLILSYNGSYNPRLIRGSKDKLSNHSIGLALDFNASWNRLGMNPTPAGQKGSLIPLVPIFNKYGFFWGGTFKRKDGMHFEAHYIL